MIWTRPAADAHTLRNKACKLCGTATVTEYCEERAPVEPDTYSVWTPCCIACRGHVQEFPCRENYWQTR